MLGTNSKIANLGKAAAGGDFLTIGSERFYKISDVDKMAPFFISVVSNTDHWLFVSSNGGLTAGRISPETALFPYIPVDKIHESDLHTGPKTIIRLGRGAQSKLWEPFNREHDGRYAVERNLYKNTAGNKLCFEEVNHDLNLTFRYTWTSSDQYGFCRQCELQNLGDQRARIELLDGMQNILPAGTPAGTQGNASNLVDAYKWTELDTASGLGLFTLYSGVSDRAEPAESLRANTVFCLGLDIKTTLISSLQLKHFRAGETLHQETRKRGIRGAYFVNAEFALGPHAAQNWQLVANIEQDQGQVTALQKELDDVEQIAIAISKSIESGTDELSRIIASADGMQCSAEENVVTHHYANVLYNVLRGGIFDDQYTILSADFKASVKHFNTNTYQRNQVFLDALPARQNAPDLLAAVRNQGDEDLERLSLDYLPVTFGRRHGDPSRPWNHFSIKLKDANGDRLLAYEGNWRDIFQNWEALALSYPEFTQNIIARFVNASTMDGYNPYRINKKGIDWEVEEADDPWSYIGYWGDHQIIYLQKLLEISDRFHPNKLSELLRRPLFSYANVPYRIKPFGALLENPKSTVEFDYAAAAEIEQRVARMGADGKLILNNNGEVYLVTLLEKLLVPLLAKLGNLVIDGGIWLNTQRPEWNDANNALVGHGLSMVTLYYMRRYVRFLQRLMSAEQEPIEISADVKRWLASTSTALHNASAALGNSPATASQRYDSLRELGEAASDYRESVYRTVLFCDKEPVSPEQIADLLDAALVVIEHSINTGRRDDGLYHAYNILHLQADELTIDTLYPMLEGQVAALSSGAVSPQTACTVLEALFSSGIYRPDQHSFMLYPDRSLPAFLQRNKIADADVDTIPLLGRMLASGDQRLVYRDAEGCHRFNADFANADVLDDAITRLVGEYGDDLEIARKPLKDLYEKVFSHRTFTGRSGGMFGFEGLGCIYWHMVAKLLLAVQEIFFAAKQRGADAATCQKLGNFYYRVRAGIGFNKTPAEYGAFPYDPYSHTPAHAGARQPGMTGQVKEEILTRFGELGVCVQRGAVYFDPQLLRRREFRNTPGQFRYLDVAGRWQKIEVPIGSLAFTWCQVPITYSLNDAADPSILIRFDDGERQQLSQHTLTTALSSELFNRSGRIRQLDLVFGNKDLFAE